LSRRCLLSLLISVAVCLWALGLASAVAAQPPGKVHRVGFLSYFGCATAVATEGAFRKELRGLGYVEGQNLVIECRDAPGRVDRLSELAADLVQRKVDVLVAEATPSSLAAKSATTTTPIVMVAVADPVRKGLIASFARPGGNVTGVSGAPTLEVYGKVLELLKEVAPHVSRVAVLTDRTNPGQVLMDDAVNAIGRALKIQLRYINVRGAGDVENALVETLNWRAEALFLYPLPVETAEVHRIATFALTKRLPAVTLWEGYAEEGLLMFYGTGMTDLYRRAAVYVDKILKGAKPADLPVEQAMTFPIVINLKTAKALGVTIPPSVLVRTDKVIK